MDNTIKFVAVCVAAPVVALGVGAPAAWASPSTSGDHGATVSINGVTKHQGPASAFAAPSSGPAPNVAIAVGQSPFDRSSAVVFGPGSGNKAIAIKGGSALVQNGSNNTAVATGNNPAIAVGVSGTHCHNADPC